MIEGMPKKQKGVDKVTVSNEVAALLDVAKDDNDIISWVYDMKSHLLEDKLAGEGIRKEQIPKYYKVKYGVDNLYRYELPKYHRACYTITCIENVWYASILEVMSHPEYDKRFGY